MKSKQTIVAPLDFKVLGWYGPLDQLHAGLLTDKLESTASVLFSFLVTAMT